MKVQATGDEVYEDSLFSGTASAIPYTRNETYEGQNIDPSIDFDEHTVASQGGYKHKNQQHDNNQAFYIENVPFKNNTSYLHSASSYEKSDSRDAKYYQKSKGTCSDSKRERRSVFDRLTRAPEVNVQEKDSYLGYDECDVDASVDQVMDMLHQSLKQGIMKAKKFPLVERHHPESDTLKMMRMKVKDDVELGIEENCDQLIKETRVVSFKRRSETKRNKEGNKTNSSVETGGHEKEGSVQKPEHEGLEGKQHKCRKLLRPLSSLESPSKDNEGRCDDSVKSLENGTVHLMPRKNSGNDDSSWSVLGRKESRSMKVLPEISLQLCRYHLMKVLMPKKRAPEAVGASLRCVARAQQLHPFTFTSRAFHCRSCHSFQQKVLLAFLRRSPETASHRRLLASIIGDSSNIPHSLCLSLSLYTLSRTDTHTHKAHEPPRTAATPLRCLRVRPPPPPSSSSSQSLSSTAASDPTETHSTTTSYSPPTTSFPTPWSTTTPIPTTAFSGKGSDDRIDELDDVEARVSDEEEEDEADQSRVSKYYFDHVNGVIRRAFDKRSIDQWEDYESFDAGVGRRIRATWRSVRTMWLWMKIFLNPLNNPILQDPDGVGITGLTRGDRIVMKGLSNEFKKVPFLVKKPLGIIDLTHESNLNSKPKSEGNVNVNRKEFENVHEGRSEMKRAERRTLDDNASDFSGSRKIVDTGEGLSISNAVNFSLSDGSEGIKQKTVGRIGKVLDTSASNSVQSGGLKKVEPNTRIKSEFSGQVYADGKRWGYFPSLHPRLSFPNFMDAFFRKGKCSLRVFMVWNSPPWMFSVRHQRGLESLLLHHGDACVVVFSETIELNFFEAFVKDGELVRLAALHKYGGLYLDSDIIILRSLSSLNNTVGFEGQLAGSYLNGAVMSFRKHSETVLASKESRVAVRAAWARLTYTF
ncbi:alpha 1,4-glycosyltransferase family protein [Actinidia rufa]|uniref:Alpha 1,4-glycosyltransferase family protein n=1 Tax=Actinidia rufa TaxID=165716 RepID=A0A7J0DY01_9ERIC|nr:alpha 1,4-glycosyltransferase family protein [Actinidia rufa]